MHLQDLKPKETCYCRYAAEVLGESTLTMTTRNHLLHRARKANDHTSCDTLIIVTATLQKGKNTTLVCLASRQKKTNQH